MFYRLASPEMCYDHFKYLLQIYETLEHRKDHLNTVILSNLLSRQYNFLADKDKADFINSIMKCSKSFQWSPIIRGIDPQIKKQIQQQVDTCSVNNKISDDLKQLEEQSSLNSLTDLVNAFFKINKHNYSTYIRIALNSLMFFLVE